MSAKAQANSEIGFNLTMPGFTCQRAKKQAIWQLGLSHIGRVGLAVTLANRLCPGSVCGQIGPTVRQHFPDGANRHLAAMLQVVGPIHLARIADPHDNGNR